MRPNITGVFWNLATQSDIAKLSMGSFKGAFIQGDIKDGIAYGQYNWSSSANDGIALNASLSSNAYGKSPTVQPISIRLLPIIKI